ncbi:ParB N-terminal domain-containing protein [Streptomyces chrestomyceticus]|uniref:ParB N-terminal domain-containing protein n=1 Tax=Streptomyces chrestomyceticus TaxID=68185 RepID=A0ABU7WKS9_9ACTN
MEPGQAHLDMQTVVEVEINSLSVAGSPRISGEDIEHVEMLTVAQAPLPPIIAHRATMRVIDGVHRLRAAERRGDDKIAVRFFDGDEADAFVLAVESNITHGLPLSMADRKNAAERIIRSHPLWSDRMIASVTGIAPGTVAEIRRRVAGAAAAGRGRIGQDGRFRPLNGAEGRRLAGNLIAENPGLSLRQIARASGISPETARDVRNRLRRGEEPLLKGRGRPARAPQEQLPAGPADAGDGGDGTAPVRMPVQDRTVVVRRLKVDPALRFSETGRTLLRLLSIHTISAEEWDDIMANIPPHCSGIIAQLARECADIWADFAQRAERNVAEAV